MTEQGEAKWHIALKEGALFLLRGETALFMVAPNDGDALRCLEGVLPLINDLEAQVAALRVERDELRDSKEKLHRRAQIAEAAAGQTVEKVRREGLGFSKALFLLENGRLERKLVQDQARIDALESVLRRIGFDEETSYLACSDLPHCSGYPHNEDCAVGIAREALRQDPSTSSGRSAPT